MIWLLLAILSSAMVSIIMRLSTDRVKNNVAMLVMNYLMCLILSLLYAGNALPGSPSALPAAAAMGAIHGALYLASFALLQLNVKKNGVVLSATFMKLGLLVPMVVSVFLFGELPSAAQIAGFVTALAAILLINMEKGAARVRSGAGLILLLLGGGAADAMSKVFEELGDRSLADVFLVFTFIAALLLSILLMFSKKQRPERSDSFWGLLIGIPNFFSAKFLLLSLRDISAVIVYPTYSVATMLVITLTGVFAFREKLGRRQWIALGVILAALVLLNI